MENKKEILVKDRFKIPLTLKKKGPSNIKYAMCEINHVMTLYGEP